MTIFDKDHSKTLFQGDIVLPPSWVAKQNKQSLAQSFTQPLTAKAETVFISGGERHLADNVITLLENAQQMVVICSFLLADQAIEDAIYNAAERGIRVYLMLASEARLGNATGEDDFSQKVLQQHKTMLKRLGGKVLIRSAEHYHAKLVLADPFGDQPKGFMLTANLTKEAIERNEELAIVLTRAEVIEVTRFIHWGIWEAAEHEMNDNSVFRSVKPLQQVTHPENTTRIFATTPRSTTLQDKVLQVINAAKTQLIVASFGWQADHPVVEVLTARAQAGLDITILARIRPKTMPALIKLAKAGAKIVGFKWLHAKAIWSDQNEALMMSANIEKHGLDQGFELGVYLTDERVKPIRQSLLHWIKQAKWVLTIDQPFGDVLGLVKVWHQEQLKELNIEGLHSKKLADITADSIQYLDKAPDFPALSWLTDPCHQIDFIWSVKAPRLAPKSKEQFLKQKRKQKQQSAKAPAATPYQPPVFKQPDGRRVVAIDSPRQLPDAIKLSKTLGNAAIVVLSQQDKK